MFEYQAGFLTYLSNSLLVAGLTIVLCLALAVPAGYGLARFKIRFKEVWFILLLAPLMVPYQALLTPLYLTFSKMGLANSPSRARHGAHHPAAAVFDLFDAQQLREHSA